MGLTSKRSCNRNPRLSSRVILPVPVLIPAWSKADHTQQKQLAPAGYATEPQKHSTVLTPITGDLPLSLSDPAPMSQPHLGTKLGGVKIKCVFFLVFPQKKISLAWFHFQSVK